MPATVIDTRTASGAATPNGMLKASSGTATSASPNPNADRMSVATNTMIKTCNVVASIVISRSSRTQHTQPAPLSLSHRHNLLRRPIPSNMRRIRHPIRFQFVPAPTAGAMWRAAGAIQRPSVPHPVGNRGEIRSIRIRTEPDQISRAAFGTLDAMSNPCSHDAPTISRFCATEGACNRNLSELDANRLDVPGHRSLYHWTFTDLALRHKNSNLHRCPKTSIWHASVDYHGQAGFSAAQNL